MKSINVLIHSLKGCWCLEQVNITFRACMIAAVIDVHDLLVPGW